MTEKFYFPLYNRIIDSLMEKIDRLSYEEYNEMKPIIENQIRSIEKFMYGRES